MTCNHDIMKNSCCEENDSLRQRVAELENNVEKALHWNALKDEQLAAMTKERDEAADKALHYASKYNDIVQAITDPENQPSQYGTVLMSQLAVCEKEMDYWRTECKDLCQSLGIEKQYWDGSMFVKGDQ